MASPTARIDAHAAATGERIARAAQGIVTRLVADPERRAERLGEVFLACERAARDHPVEFGAALEQGDLEPFLLRRVDRSCLRGDSPQSFSGGWLGTFVGPDARSAEPETESTTDQEALALSRQALHRAVSLAKAEGNDTLLRNLRWYSERLAHKSYAAIARSERKVPATIRTGVARARRCVLRVVHELRHSRPAPLNGEAPPEIEPLRRLWFEQDVEGLTRELERTRATHGDDPHWLNLAALVAADRCRPQEAARLYERALVFADAPGVRGRLLNNLGNLAEDRGDLETGRSYWLRARTLVPHAPAPLLNLLAAASLTRDYASAQHYVADLGELLASGRLVADERRYVLSRLRENPKLTWLRDTEVWRLGPQRWLRSAPRGVGAAARACVAAKGIALALLLLPACSFAHAAAFDRIALPGRSLLRAPHAVLATPRQPGVDPLPAYRSVDGSEPRGRRIAGDSMGRSGGGRPGGGRPGRPGNG
jgi:tetratricopeptide (TPR) repeat protein